MIAASLADIPTGVLYVAMTDKFMSGWGAAEGLTNRHVIPCSTAEEAAAVEAAAKARPEMIRVTVNIGKPRPREGVLLTWSKPDGWLR